MSLAVLEEPGAEPLSLGDAKAHLHVIGNDDDAYIEGLIKSVRAYAEEFMGRALVQRSVVWKLDRFPDCKSEALLPPITPIQSIESISYVDSSGETQEWDEENYVLDADDKKPRIKPAYGQNWPTDVLCEMNAVQIQMIIGYPADEDVSPPDPTSSIPAGIIHALRLVLGHWYETRTAVVVGTITAEVPLAVPNLLKPYKSVGF